MVCVYIYTHIYIHNTGVLCLFVCVCECLQLQFFPFSTRLMTYTLGSFTGVKRPPPASLFLCITNVCPCNFQQKGPPVFFHILHTAIRFLHIKLPSLPDLQNPAETLPPLLEMTKIYIFAVKVLNLQK